MDRIEIFRSPFYGHPLALRLVYFAVVEGAFGGIFYHDLVKADLHAPVFWIGVVLLPALSVFFVLMFFRDKAVDLLPSRPPVVVTTKRWFGKDTSTRQEALDGAAGVQVSREVFAGDNGPFYSVEVVQPGRWATMTSKHDDSPEGLELAKAKCTELATLLGLEDQGYRH